MHDLNQELEALAREGTPRGATELMAGARASLEAGSAPSKRRVTNRPLVTAFVATLAIAALVAGALAVVRTGDDPPARVATGDSSGTTAPAVENGSPLFLVPTRVPEGFELIEATGGDAVGTYRTFTESAEWDVRQLWVRFDDGHEHPVDVIRIQRGTRTRTETTDALSGFGLDAVATTVRGHEGVYSASNGLLAWTDTGGAVIEVSGVHATAHEQPPAVPKPLERSLLERVAASLDVQASRLALPDPPAGFELEAEWPGSGSEGTNPRVLEYAGPNGAGFLVHVVDNSDEPPGINLSYSDARLVDVRDHEAVSTPLLGSPPPFDAKTSFLMAANRYVQWFERDRTRVTISGVGLDEAQVLDIARSLEPIDAATWASMRTDLDQPTLPAPSIAPASTPGSPNTTPTTAATNQVHISGSYHGTAKWGPTNGPCAELEHHLDSTFTLTDGRTWTFHSDYCGTVYGNIWTGTGTFTFTTSDGAQLSGTTTNSVTLPTTGEPYTLDVRGGTSEFDRATGSCELDNHVKAVSDWVQDQTGTFTCDLALRG
jgi:hypothetical protein